MCYNSDFSLSENESICDDGEEVHAYLGQRVVAPEEVAALSRAVISEPIVSDSRSAFFVEALLSIIVSLQVLRRTKNCLKVSSKLDIK